MVTIKTVICLGDEQYEKALSYALNMIGGFDAYRCTHSCNVSYEDAINGEEVDWCCADVLVTTPQLQKVIGDEHEFEEIILLLHTEFEDDLESSGKSSTLIDKSESAILDMFSDVRLLADAIRRAKGVLNLSSDCKGESTCKIILCASSSGRDETASIAISLGRSLYRTFEEKSLYVSLCPFNHTAIELLRGSSYIEGGEYSGFIEYVYGAKHDSPPDWHKVIKEAEEISYLDIKYYNRHCNEFTIKALELLKNEAFARGYSYIICDIGAHFEGQRRDISRRAFASIIINPQKELTDMFSGRIIRIGTGEGGAELDFELPDMANITRRSQDEDLGVFTDKLAIEIGGTSYETKH